MSNIVLNIKPFKISENIIKYFFDDVNKEIKFIFYDFSDKKLPALTKYR